MRPGAILILLRVLRGTRRWSRSPSSPARMIGCRWHQEAYGYTVLRLFVDGFERWLGLVVVLGAVAVSGCRVVGWPPRSSSPAAVFTLVFVAMNPDAWVAQRGTTVRGGP